MPVLHSDV
jgi:DNA-binding response OmpR family regulator